MSTARAQCPFGVRRWWPGSRPETAREPVSLWHPPGAQERPAHRARRSVPTRQPCLNRQLGSASMIGVSADNGRSTCPASSTISFSSSGHESERRAKHCRLHADAVQVVEDGLSPSSGRTVLWTTPEFVPLLSRRSCACHSRPAGSLVRAVVSSESPSTAAEWNFLRATSSLAVWGLDPSLPGRRLRVGAW